MVNVGRPTPRSASTSTKCPSIPTVAQLRTRAKTWFPSGGRGGFEIGESGFRFGDGCSLRRRFGASFEAAGGERRLSRGGGRVNGASGAASGAAPTASLVKWIRAPPFHLRLRTVHNSSVWRACLLRAAPELPRASRAQVRGVLRARAGFQRDPGGHVQHRVLARDGEGDRTLQERSESGNADIVLLQMDGSGSTKSRPPWACATSIPRPPSIPRATGT